MVLRKVVPTVKTCEPSVLGVADLNLSLEQSQKARGLDGYKPKGLKLHENQFTFIECVISQRVFTKQKQGIR